MPRAAALALLLVSVTACSAEEWSRGGLPKGVTEQSDAVQSLWNGSWIAALATGVVVWGLILWSVAFHRKRKNSKEQLPPQVRYNLPIEILYTVIPIIMVGVFFYFTARDQNYITSVSGKPDVKVKVEAFQWSWRFTTEYNGKSVQVVGLPVNDYTKGPQLVLPVEKNIEFDLTAPDVIHSFWVPAFHFKRDVIPGVKDNKFEVKTLGQTGVFAGRCAELCGVDHSKMLFSVKLVPQAEFDQYIASQAGAQ
ncbi:cytochrome c oxidase subunit 2 [Streptosporangium becharense]|uniref:aa3-type cytochrome oxidase subunit II n=1 Tax=Streptosporangium becharense TaxID=1816182 RepID=UPI00180144EC|nr:cytochrome c oxidase subunit II [Streptosporangium becharense]MBB2911900.1 cytochrome c oxidase subunit 2 [Streptosporangium becharense]